MDMLNKREHKLSRVITAIIIFLLMMFIFLLAVVGIISWTKEGNREAYRIEKRAEIENIS